MTFDKKKFILGATQTGMAEMQVNFLAEQFRLSYAAADDLLGLEHKLRDEFNASIFALGEDAEARAILARVQLDDLSKDFLRMEARVEGSLRIGKNDVTRAIYANSALHSLAIITVMGVYIYWWV